MQFKIYQNSCKSTITFADIVIFKSCAQTIMAYPKVGYVRCPQSTVFFNNILLLMYKVLRPSNFNAMHELVCLKAASHSHR